MTTIVNYATGRTLRVVLALTCLLILVSGRGSGVPGILQAQANPVVAENLLPGDPDWDVPGQGAGSESIQGFASDMSVNLGETIQFKIDTSSSNYRIDIYRLGYYNGAGARKVATIANADIIKINQPNCATDTTTGLVDCGNWGTTASWTVPASMVSGVYIAKPTRTTTTGTPATSSSSSATTRAGRHPVADLGHDVAGLQPVRRQQPVLRRAESAMPARPTRCPGRAAKVSYNRPFDTRAHEPAELPVQRRIPDDALPRSERLQRQVLVGRRHRSLRRERDDGPDQRARSRRFSSRSATTSTGRAGSAPTSRTRATPASTSRSSAATRCTGRRGGNRAIDGSRHAHRTLVCYKETLAGVEARSAAGRLRPAPGATRASPRHRRRPPGERADRHDLDRQLLARSAITVPSSMAGLRFWRNTRVAALLAGETATLAPGTLGYEWGEELDNGFQPAGLVRMSSTTVANQEKIIDFGAHVGTGTATHTLTLYRHNERRARLRRQHRAVGVGPRRRSRRRTRGSPAPHVRTRRCSRRP